MRTPRPYRLAFFSFGLLALGVSTRARAAEPGAITLPAAPANAAASATSSSSTPAPDAPPAITMPVPKKNEGAAYPQQALAEGFFDPADVHVLVTVSTTGEVTAADVETPVGHGFDEAALAAAKAMVFDPATRDGRPIAARTRVAFHFDTPRSVLSGRVVSLAGEHPLAGATVTAHGPGGDWGATAGPDGEWRLSGLAAGAYHVTVSADGMLSSASDETIAPGQEVHAVDRLDAAKSAPKAAAAGDEDVQEVEVRGTRPPREVVKRTLEQRELNRIPGTGGDALKSLQNLPGVARTPSLSGLLVVRGSAPQDSVYFVDGTPIPIVYHFGGLFSVLPTEVIDRIDFYPGNFSAQFGRAMGAVVDVGLASPKSDRLHAMVEANLIDARFLLQGPVFDTGWRFSVAGRRSYVDTWLGPVLNSTGASVSVAPVYYDYQAILERDINARSNFRLSFFGSDDRLSILLPDGSSSNPTLAGALTSHMGFWRAQALYRNKISDRTELRLVGAVGQDFADFGVGNISFHLLTWPITGRAEVAQKLEKRLTMNVGLDIIYTPYDLSAVFPPLPKAGQPPPGPFSSQVPLSTQNSDSIYRPAAYVEWEATPWRGSRIVPGLRLDYTKETKAWDFDPRIVVRQDVTSSPRTTIKAGVGVFAQAPQPQETNPVFGTPGLSNSRAVQYDLGVEREINPHIDASVDGFYKSLESLVRQGYGSTGSGEVFGAEMLLRYKPDEHFFGWISYTLSRSTRRDAPGLPLRLSLYDETHVLAVLGSYRLGHGWELGARFRLVSGYMYTPEKYGFFDENVATYVPLQDYPENGSRLPLFHSIDIRVDKTWKYPWGQIGAYLDVLNAYDNGNVDGINYDYNDTHSSYTNDLPIIPSLGLRVEM